jgi:uncharacterized protein with NRDE domain
VCTLILAYRVWPGIPLWVAANRDEKLSRPSGGPRIWREGPASFLAPVDRVKGGTWIGLSATGVFAGITNRLGTVPADPGRRSRGLLVVDALLSPSARTARDRIAALDPHAVNRFHLLVADRAGAYLVWSDGERLAARDLAAGIHVLTERSLGSAVAVREQHIAAALGRYAASAPPSDATLQKLLSFHGDDPFEGTCVHAPSYQYGTLSSTWIRVQDDPAGVKFFHPGAG